VQVVKAMYNNASSRVRVNGAYSEPVDIKVGVHQGSVLSPLLFLIVLEALSREFRTGCPWELLYADDLVLIDEDLVKLIERLGTWKRNLEAHGLRVNMGKTKGMVTGRDLETLRDSGKYPCGVCRQGVGVNSIFCWSCNHWIHHRPCSGIRGRLKEDPNFKCSRCLGTARPIDARPVTEFAIGEQKIDVVDCFCYLGNSTCAGGGAPGQSPHGFAAPGANLRNCYLCSPLCQFHGVERATFLTQLSAKLCFMLVSVGHQLRMTLLG